MGLESVTFFKESKSYINANVFYLTGKIPGTRWINPGWLEQIFMKRTFFLWACRPRHSSGLYPVKLVWPLAHLMDLVINLIFLSLHMYITVTAQRYLTVTAQLWKGHGCSDREGFRGPRHSRADHHFNCRNLQHFPQTSARTCSKKLLLLQGKNVDQPAKY